MLANKCPVRSFPDIVSVPEDKSLNLQYAEISCLCLFYTSPRLIGFWQHVDSRQMNLVYLEGIPRDYYNELYEQANLDVNQFA